VRAPPAAGSVLELGGPVHSSGRLCSFILCDVFAFAFASRQAAIRHSNFRVAVMGADELKWLFPQEKATLLDLRCRTLTLELL
jgi:hypothetical protein